MTKAKIYNIATSAYRFKDIEDQWSGCNGVDGFGNIDKDAELNRARCRYPVRLYWAGLPTLVLYRPKKSQPLMCKIWHTRVLLSYEDHLALMASLSKALVKVGVEAQNFDIDLFDYYGNVPEQLRNTEDRYELSIELCGPFSNIKDLKKVWQKFMKYFDDTEWV